MGQKKETDRGSQRNRAAGGAVVRALQADNQFQVRALTRNPAKHRELADIGVGAALPAGRQTVGPHHQSP